MYINTDCENFIPRDFVILNFYGQDTCFAWNENEFICFPYLYKNSTKKLQVLKAPTLIKDIRGFSNRVFILCSPTGIYKLTDDFEFANLSKTGIELASDFCEVLTINNEMLILEDKKRKSIKNLIPISKTSNVHTLTLNYKNNDTDFFKIFLSEKSSDNINLCFISNDNKLFKMLDQVITIFYSCEYLIKNIKSVEKDEKAIGILLQTDTNVAIFIHVVDNKLMFDKIFLEVNVQTICAVIDKNIENELVIVYSDDVKTYYSRKILTGDSVQDVRIEKKHYESLRLYQSKFLVYLQDTKELFQTDIEQLRNTNNQNTNDYVKLELNMLKGLEKITEMICDKTTELKILTDKMIEKEDRLKRINLFVNKQNIKYYPDEHVKRILNEIFIVSNFKRILPENSTIVKILKNKGKTIFSMKNVKDYDTVIEMPICIPNLSSKLCITTDLITHKSDEIWCLIKNYIRNPITSKSKKLYLTADKLNFVKYKLTVLQNLMKTNDLNLEVISRIKREVRQEIQIMNILNDNLQKN